ncbi:hypothetical protein MATL_G00114610 [Megalops atlanticus]|uniref:Uncharacterized protein n=1 Tax=Megalops atlanticus TaxID=7932 RepID=A0A9D3T558_MEGAT|nr:hypothetical protein MATL_G00114610 [Megalops atlanticus]
MWRMKKMSSLNLVGVRISVCSHCQARRAPPPSHPLCQERASRPLTHLTSQHISKARWEWLCFSGMIWLQRTPHGSVSLPPRYWGAPLSADVT